MMNKCLMMAGAAMMAAAAMAAQDDLLVSFSTPGPDKYADGTAVLDGECYALVWSADGVFDGIKADGAPVDANDKVLVVAPVAKGGRCPEIIYQAIDQKDEKNKSYGEYDVYLLDTRVKTASGEVALAEIVGGKPAAVNGVAAVAQVAGGGDGAVATATLAGSAVNGASVAVATVVDVPVITGIKVDGAKVTLKVAALSPIASYKVVAGKTPGDVAEEVPATVKDGAFEFAKPEGSFFKVIGTRNFSK